jgi:hypothetical protein
MNYKDLDDLAVAILSSLLNGGLAHWINLTSSWRQVLGCGGEHL